MIEWEDLRILIKDRMEASELVELLELSIDDVMDAFKEEIQNSDAVLEELGIGEDEVDE